MPTRYVSSLLGNDAWDGSSPTWVAGLVGPKATLTSCEAIPVVAGDTVWVQGGSFCVYRELLTCGVSGAAGTPITYVGDVLGQIAGWQGSMGMARITGSDNDQTAARASCITGTTRSYRTFRGFALDTCTSYLLNGGNDTRTNWIIEDSTFQGVNAQNLIATLGANQLAWIVRRCVFYVPNGSSSVYFYHNVDVSNTSHLVENCTFVGVGNGVSADNMGNVLVRNCVGIGNTSFVRVNASPAAGQTVVVNNCTIYGANVAVYAPVLGDLIEDYNSFYGCSTARTNVAVGANSQTYPPLFNLGLLHSGAGQVSGFRLPQPIFGALSTWSQVRAIADTGAATLDLQGNARPATAGKRSWGAVQFQNEIRDTGTVRGGVASLKFEDAGRKQFKIPVTAVNTTVSVYAYREANYAGVNPQMVIKQAGVADRTTTDAGAAGAWNQLTDTWVPAATPGWSTVELVSNNTDAANPATNDAFFEDLSVTVNTSLGTMETWMWDTEVADWVQNIPAGGGGGPVSISPYRGNIG